MEETTTFYHKSVLLEESIEALEIKPDGVYVDATFGGGGHSREILKHLGPKGTLISFDHDKDAWQNAIDDPRCILVKENFRYIKQFLKYLSFPKVDGILADLGVSSFQFDTASRGFSIRYDAELDMRMDERISKTAADILNEYSEHKLHKMFESYGQVRNAKTLAALIVERRNVAPYRTINDFKKNIESIIKGNPNKYLAQVFQALRIEVNEELIALEEFLKAAAECLQPQGRLAIITFHSLEDRMVKQYMKQGGLEQIELDPFGRRIGKPKLQYVGDVVPSEEEIRQNSRSRSARLRIANGI